MYAPWSFRGHLGVGCTDRVLDLLFTPKHSPLLGASGFRCQDRRSFTRSRRTLNTTLGDYRYRKDIQSAYELFDQNNDRHCLRRIVFHLNIV